MEIQSPTESDRESLGCAIYRLPLGCVFDLSHSEVRAVKTTISASSTLRVVAGARMGASIGGFVVAPVFKH
jgi:hypothetical protein